MANPVIHAERLTKRFGHAHALTDLNLTVEPGQVHAFLGPNGAGKSTTIRILLGLLEKTSGTVELFGSDPWRNAAELHRRLAYVPGDVTLWPNLSGGEIIDLLGRLRGGVSPQRKSELLERFALDPGKKARTYSKGNRQKVALVAAFAAETELLILDEPTSGLDPLMEEVFTQCLFEEKARGTSILLSSHILSEVDRVADHVTIIRDGATVETGSLQSLRHLSRTRIEATLTDPLDLAGLPGVHDVHTDADTVSFAVDSGDLSRALAELAAAHPTSLVSRPPTLEEMFLRHYDTAPALR